MNLDEAFETFYNAIQLRALSEERIGSAWRRLHEFLTDAFDLPPDAVFIQGSYANDTAIRPADQDGEYDLDIVAVCAAPGASAANAIADLREKLEGDADLAKRLESDEEGRPCVRLRYAKEGEGFGFHVDVVPARPGTEDAPLEVPMRGREEWRGTDPLAYTQWCLDGGELFRRPVRELKRWRDVNDASIKSIVLQVLIGYSMPNAGTDAERIVLTLENIMGRLNAHPDKPPMIQNPVLPSEDLASRWETGDYKSFIKQLAQAITKAKRAQRSDDEQESHDLWQELFGDDFPDSPKQSKSGIVPPPPPPQTKPKPDRGRRYG